MNRCPHGVECGPLETETSSYCDKCSPRIYQDQNGNWTYSIEYQYLTDDEKRTILANNIRHTRNNER